MTRDKTIRSYRGTRNACYYAYLAMASIFCLPSMLFLTFRETYGISFTLLGTLVLVNFCTQFGIDLIFTLFSRHFSVKWTIRFTPVLTALGLSLYALIPRFFPSHAYLGLLIGTFVFSVAAGLGEVLISPIVAALPSEHPDRDMSRLHSLYGYGVLFTVAVSTLFLSLCGTDQWYLLALLLAVFPLIAGLIFFLVPIPDVELHGEADKKQAASVALSRRKGLVLCVFCIFLGSCAENAMTNWISSFLESALRIPKAVGDVAGLAAFAMLLALVRTVYAKIGRNILGVLLVGMIGATVCYLTAALAPSAILAMLACILTGVFTSMLWPGTLILMEERFPAPGVAAYALMAAGGDLGGSVAPQMLGAVVDAVSASPLAQSLSPALGLSAEQIGMKAGMLAGAIFPFLGIFLLLYMRRFFRRRAES